MPYRRQDLPAPVTQSVMVAKLTRGRPPVITLRREDEGGLYSVPSR